MLVPARAISEILRDPAVETGRTFAARIDLEEACLEDRLTLLERGESGKCRRWNAQTIERYLIKP